MLKFPVLLIAVCWSLRMWSQTVFVSDDFSVSNDYGYEIIGKYKGSVLLFRDRVSEYEIQAYDEQMRMSWKKNIELDKRRTQVLSLVATKNDIYVIYQAQKRSGTVVKLHRLSPAAVLEDSVTIRNLGEGYDGPTPVVVRSEDKSHILVCTRTTDRRQFVQATVFNLEKMEKVWERSFFVERPDEDDRFNPILLANDGTAYWIYERNNSTAESELHQIEVITANAFGKYSFFVPLRKFYTYDARFVLDNLNHRIVGGGLYSEKNRNRAKGCYLLNIPMQDTSKTLLSMTPFSDVLVSRLSGKEVTNNKGIADIVVEEIVLRKDGGTLLVIEQNKKVERRLASNRGTWGNESALRLILDYYVDDMVLVALHPGGNIHWSTILHKRQYSSDDDGVFCSYFLMKTPGSLRFLFNDEIKDETTVSEYMVNANGEYERNSLLSTENKKLRLRFKAAVQVAANEVIIPSEYRSRLKLVKIKY